MNSNKKIDQGKLDDFLNEINNSNKDKANSTIDANKATIGISKPYQCPSCHKSLSSRKEPCKYCGYKGYIPMGDDEIKRTRVVLFVIILIIAVVVYILTRR